MKVLLFIMSAVIPIMTFSLTREQELSHASSLSTVNEPTVRQAAERSEPQVAATPQSLVYTEPVFNNHHPHPHHPSPTNHHPPIDDCLPKPHTHTVAPNRSRAAPAIQKNGPQHKSDHDHDSHNHDRFHAPQQRSDYNHDRSTKKRTAYVIDSLMSEPNLSCPTPSPCSNYRVPTYRIRKCYRNWR